MSAGKGPIVGAAAKALGYRVQFVESCGSTNDLAMQALREGADRLWIVAAEQNAGRGRLGRTWTPRPGNLYASLALVDPAPGAQAPQIGFVAALAAHDAAAAQCATGAARLALKWPNDLLLDGRKTAGILVEGASLVAGRLGVVVGVGVNVVDHPEGTRYGATELRAAATQATADSVFAALSDAFALRLAQWRDEGFAATRRDWLERAAGLNGPARVDLGSEILEGRFEGIDADGRLLLRGAQGARLIAAGDVFLPGM